jgi:hypothetical protein
MEEFTSLPEQMQSDLLPDEFVDNPELYVMQNGRLDIQPLYNYSMAFETCLIVLKSGDKLQYENTRTLKNGDSKNARNN